MELEELFERFKIKKFPFGKELGYKSPAGIYKALNNPNQRPLILAYLKVKILEDRGINVNSLIKSIDAKSK